jgi:acyl carrier protein
MLKKEMCTVDLVIDVLVKEVGLSNITSDMTKLSWEEQGVDSLGFVELIAGLGDALAVPISYEGVKHTKNIGELTERINSLHMMETV